MKLYPGERLELFKAWTAVSFAFAVLFSGGISQLFSFDFLRSFLVSWFTVGIGFFLHELAHKLFAQRYHCEAQFKSDSKMLLLMIVTSFLGFVLAAPGGVLIRGRISLKQHGVTSFVGPFTNILTALFFWLASFSFPAFQSSLLYGFAINSWLALFNMLPFPGFDGAPVFAWNKALYFFTISIAAIMTFFSV